MIQECDIIACMLLWIANGTLIFRYCGQTNHMDNTDVWAKYGILKRRRVWSYHLSHCRIQCFPIISKRKCRHIDEESIHYRDVIISVMASQINSVSTFCSTVCSGADQRKISKLRVTGLCEVIPPEPLCEGNPPVAGGFPSQRASNAENVSFWWRHHGWPHTHAVCVVCVVINGIKRLTVFKLSLQLTVVSLLSRSTG